MPNWTTNELTIRGNSVAIQRMLSKIAGEPDAEGDPRYIDFYKIVPMPDILKNTTAIGDKSRYVDNSIDQKSNAGLKKWMASMRPFTNKEKSELTKTGFYNWHDWKRVNWGTKWNVDSSFLEYSEYSVSITFLTANALPIQILQALRHKYPKLCFELQYQNEEEEKFRHA